MEEIKGLLRIVFETSFWMAADKVMEKFYELREKYKGWRYRNKVMLPDNFCKLNRRDKRNLIYANLYNNRINN